MPKQQTKLGDALLNSVAILAIFSRSHRPKTIGVSARLNERLRTAGEEA